MVTFEEMGRILDEIADGFPEELFKELSGGIVLAPELKLNQMSMNNDLYILGEYHRGFNSGRYIVIYYGSFMKVYGYLEDTELKERLEHTLKHEFIHHLESLAGEKGLEKEDAKNLFDYIMLRDWKRRK
ncbi:metallopeptidase family protein [Youngiibacter multivorans]|uniref:Zn-dependent protease with MMP-like domain n=1 Tax=Youngiibacter multivorans TaxID=937251 RepID=A0ABS4G6S7_9CLOT|nr:metallopeptidase family protein [Youngiibacter multivorans]MBP1920231.1 putative Zn-dependent protease with MMP-like domain [Youngiibacter multivorans]